MVFNFLKINKVMITQDEYNDLVYDYWIDTAKNIIMDLDLYLWTLKKDPYKHHYSVCLTRLRKRNTKKINRNKIKENEVKIELTKEEQSKVLEKLWNTKNILLTKFTQNG